MKMTDAAGRQSGFAQKRGLIKNSLMLIALLLPLAFTACFEYTFGGDDDDVADFNVDGLTGEGSWVVMVYMAGDNNLEKYTLLDTEEMAGGYSNDKNMTVLLLVDRADVAVPGDTAESGIFGENFTDTRLYKLAENRVERLGGGSAFPEIGATGSWEANTGDAAVLKKFIRFAKTEYPADKYALVIWNHGSGTRGAGDIDLTRGAASDNSSGDMLYVGELSDVLGVDESVDLLGFDACYMSSIELAYQYRPENGGFSADILVAAASEEWGSGWDYKAIFSRIDKNRYSYSSKNDSLMGGAEIIYDPWYMNAAEFGLLVAEEMADASQAASYGSHSFAVTNLAKVAALKTAFDELAVTLVSKKAAAETARNGAARYFTSTSPGLLLDYPFYDTASFVANLKKAGAADAALCDAVTAALDEAVIASFAGTDTMFSGFIAGVSGLSFFFPHGDSLYVTGPDTYWSQQWWYNPRRTETLIGAGSLYGNLYWCADGATAGNAAIENYFELLDCWFDTTGDTNGWDY